MTVLVVGNGAREHALATAIAADPSVESVVCAPGNAGTAADFRNAPVAAEDGRAVADLAADLRAGLVVIGPEVPLVAGVADAVRERGIACFGPSAAAARIEGSKAFAKEIMAAAGVPTARFHECDDATQVAAALDDFDPPYVIKDDALAAGKGVVVTSDRAIALAHAESCGSVVVEEFLDGPEVSLFCITDGTTVVPLLPAQDFKRLGDADSGPNTGGMGAYCPLPWAPPTLAEDVVRDVVEPTLTELAKRGTPFSGLLYVGLALTKRGPAVIEFNARFGDPETEAVLALLETPLACVLYAAATGRLADAPPLRWRAGSAVTVVLAAGGYPGPARSGDAICGALRPGVFHAGTSACDGQVISSGGRLVAVTATGPDLAAARDAAYRSLAEIEVDGGQFRTDIALAAVRGEVVVPT
ncbi:MAG: phosphoribosylamine--glycine ligase [Mycobacteriales bacterium]